MTKFAFNYVPACATADPDNADPNANNVEDFLLNTLGVDRLVPNRPDYDKPDVITFFHNGDYLIADTSTATILFDPIRPGDPTNSRISMRVNIWFGKGVIRLANDG